MMFFIGLMHKSLDDIADAVSPQVEHGREKIIRVIKDFLGEEDLRDHAHTLKYDVEKAELIEKKKKILYPFCINNSRI